ncbi:MAG: amidohydrolase family protein [Pirellulales bacterium]
MANIQIDTTMKNFFPFAAICLLAASLLRHAAASPEVPGKAPAHPVALIGGTIHPVEGSDIAGGTLLFHEGKILAIGAEVPLPADVERIDVTGKHVYPGLIEAHSDLGLVEIDSVRATRDQSETGTINPNVKAQVAFNPDSELIPVGRANGILVAVTAPTGGLISGTSAVMQLDGWSWEDMAIKPGAGLIINWPRAVGSHDWYSGHTEKIDANARLREIARIREAFADAHAYLAAKQSLVEGGGEIEFDARWESLAPIFAGTIPLVIKADAAADIQSAVSFAAAEKVRLIILGGYDAPQCAELLKKYDVPVIVSGTHRLPQHAAVAYDEAFTVPLRLHEAGVRFCISNNESAWNMRNLPYQAASAAAHGLPPDLALKSVTLFAAQILGVESRVGSLVPGKDATLIVTTGDPLEITTQVEQAFIAGKPVDLSDRHKRLYRKYQEKYRRMGE